MTETEADELKPCPFCGGKAHIVTAVGESWVLCGKCKATTSMHTSERFAIDAWNRRATLGRGTCKADKLCDGYLYYTSYWCRGCDERFAYRSIGGKDRGASPKFCPNCGRRIEEMDE